MQACPIFPRVVRKCQPRQRDGIFRILRSSLEGLGLKTDSCLKGLKLWGTRRSSWKLSDKNNQVVSRTEQTANAPKMSFSLEEAHFPTIWALFRSPPPRRYILTSQLTENKHHLWKGWRSQRQPEKPLPHISMIYSTMCENNSCL